MRVDLLTREYPPDIYGGAGVHVTELVRALRTDTEVVVRAFGEPRDEPDTASYRVPAELADANGAIATLGVDLHDAEVDRFGDGDRQAGDGDVGPPVLVKLKERPIVHLVDVVTGQDED